MECVTAGHVPHIAVASRSIIQYITTCGVTPVAGAVAHSGTYTYAIHVSLPFFQGVLPFPPWPWSIVKVVVAGDQHQDTTPALLDSGYRPAFPATDRQAAEKHHHPQRVAPM